MADTGLPRRDLVARILDGCDLIKSFVLAVCLMIFTATGLTSAMGIVIAVGQGLIAFIRSLLHV